MYRKKVIGAADIGFGWSKIAADGNLWRQPSILGEARVMPEENIRQEDVQYINGNTNYFIGDLALRHSQIKYASTAENKAQTWTTKVLLEAGLGITAPFRDIYLVTGLPVDYYLKQREGMEELLRNFNEEMPYQVQIGTQKRLARPKIVGSKVVPQPLGAAMNYLLDDTGKFKNADDAKKKIIVIDGGYYTLDILVLDAMEIAKESGSPEGLGIDTAYKLIQDYLKGVLGKAPNRYELDRYVKAGEYEGYDIQPLTDKAFKALGEQINLEIAALNTTFHKYITTGGWASRLAEALDVPGDRKVVMNQVGNLEGYLKIGARAWGAIL